MFHYEITELPRNNANLCPSGNTSHVRLTDPSEFICMAFSANLAVENTEGEKEVLLFALLLCFLKAFIFACLFQPTVAFPYILFICFYFGLFWFIIFF